MTAGGWSATAPAHAAPADIGAVARRLALPVIAIGTFFAAYLSWRPFDILLTLSDLLFAVGVALLAIGHRWPRRPMGSVMLPWLMALGAMLGGLFVGSMVNGDPARWLVAMAQYGFAYLLLPCLLIGQGRSQTVILAKALVAGVFCMELFGAGVYFFDSGGYEELRAYGPDFITGGRRLGAFLGDANWNGAVVAMAMPFVLFLRTRRQLGALTSGLALAVLATGLVLSASFTAFSCGVAACLIFMLVGGVRPSARLLVIAAAAATVYFAAGYGLPKAFDARVAPALASGDLSTAGTYTGRMELIHEAWAIVEKTSFIGIGVDEYRAVSVDRAPVHNMYLLVWAEGGALALLGWLGLLLVPAIAAISFLRHDRLAAALTLSVMTTFWIFTTASPHMYARMWTVPIFIALAFGFEALSSGGRRAPRPEQA